jgi:hypothetical protein
MSATTGMTDLKNPDPPTTPATPPRDEPAQTDERLLIAKIYGLSLLFVAIFVLILSQGSKLSSAMSQPLWASIIAVVLTAPALAPWIARTVLPRVKSLKISAVELSLRDPSDSNDSAKLALQQLSESLGDDPVLTEYAGRMTSLSSSILEAIKSVQGAGHEVLPVDLRTRWVVPNLYFLSLMALQKTGVRQIAFVDSRDVPNRFICAATPLEVLTALEWRHPELRGVARSAQFDQDWRSSDFSAGASFFQKLQELYSLRSSAVPERAATLTPESLCWLLGNAAHGDAVQWTEPPSSDTYRTILKCDAPYVAALKGTQLLYLVSRDRVAIAVARAVVNQIDLSVR